MPEKSREPSEEPDFSAKFILPLKNVEVEEGDDLILRCQISGSPRPEITWFKDGNKIIIQESNGIVSRQAPDGNCSLLIPGAKLEDIGTYSCIAKNTLGEDETSCEVTVIRPYEGGEEGKQGLPPEFVKKLTEKMVEEGETLQLEVRLKGKLEPELKW